MSHRGAPVVLSSPPADSLAARLMTRGAAQNPFSAARIASTRPSRSRPPTDAPMIHRFIARLMPGKGKAGAARVYGPKDHPIRQNQISAGALQVTRRLQEAGYKAYVVGGAVR